ncbi:MAG: DUF2059 domain-containing protein [Kiloniellales bacterium]
MKPGKIIVATLAFVLFTVRATPAVEPAKDAAIRELLEITGTMALAKQAMKQMMPSMWELVKKADPRISDDLLSVMEEEFLNAFDESLPEFIGGMVAIYDKYFTIGEINELLAFYRTELGRKTIKVMPQLLTESMSFGEVWGRDVLAPLALDRIAKRFRKKGYDL